MKGLLWTMGMLGMFFSLSGCQKVDGPKQTPDSQVTVEDAHTVLTEMLLEKYGEHFEISEVQEKSRSDIFSPHCFEVTAKTSKGDVFNVLLYSRNGALADDYASILYQDVITDIAVDTVTEKDFVSDCDLKCFVYLTEKTWVEQSQLDDFLETGEFCVNGKVVLTAQGTEETITQILDTCRALEQEKLIFFIEFVAGGKSINLNNGDNAAEISEERVQRLL